MSLDWIIPKHASICGSALWSIMPSSASEALSKRVLIGQDSFGWDHGLDTVGKLSTRPQKPIKQEDPHPLKEGPANDILAELCK